MVEFSLDKLSKLPHLSQFSLSDIFTKLGIYEDVIIDAFELEKVCEFDYQSNMNVEQLIAGKDVRMLEILKFSTEPFMLPCSKCQREQAFKDMRLNSSRSKEREIKKELNGAIGFTKIIREYGIDEIDHLDYVSYEDLFLTPSKKECKLSVLADKKFSREYVCPLEPTHRVYGEFVIEEIILKEDPPKEVKEYREKVEKAKLNNTDMPEKDTVVKEYFEKLKEAEGYIILKKIGQYPSMADMQFFECKKYRKILKGNYKDYTRALGLNASGVGCGSFLYLRRVLEMMVEEFHQECLSQDAWNEEKFQKLDFNKKIQEIERFGKRVIPNELENIRNKLYGVLSRGVHESTEDQCKELFPYVKCAIDLMLDAKITQMERADKLKEIEKKLRN